MKNRRWCTVGETPPRSSAGGAGWGTRLGCAWRGVEGFPSPKTPTCVVKSGAESDDMAFSWGEMGRILIPKNHVVVGRCGVARRETTFFVIIVQKTHH